MARAMIESFPVLTHKSMKRSLLVLAVLLIVPAFSYAAEVHCARGSTPSEDRLWDGYKVQLAPDADHPDQCDAAVTGADGKSIFDAKAPEMWVLEVSGKDVNADGKRDLVLETRTETPCCYRYFIVTPGNSPALVREVTTTPRLTFGSLGDPEHVDISTHEIVYQGIDGLDRDISPTPLIVLRMRGTSFYPVSQVYWGEYERDIQQAKMGVPQSAFDNFFGKPEDSASGRDKPKELSPDQIRQRDEAKAAVLAMYLDYVYGGRPQQAIKTLQEMWPDRDKDRIRQIVLSLRMRGVMSEINRQSTQASNPAPPTP